MIELNSAGIQELLKSPAMQGILANIGREKAAAAGDGYRSDVHVFQKRAVAHVYTASERAMRDNYENNTLLKVVGV